MHLLCWSKVLTRCEALRHQMSLFRAACLLEQTHALNLYCQWDGFCTFLDHFKMCCFFLVCYNWSNRLESVSIVGTVALTTTPPAGLEGNFTTIRRVWLTKHCEFDSFIFQLPQLLNLTYSTFRGDTYSEHHKVNTWLKCLKVASELAGGNPRLTFCYFRFISLSFRLPFISIATRSLAVIETRGIIKADNKRKTLESPQLLQTQLSDCNRRRHHESWAVLNCLPLTCRLPLLWITYSAWVE